MSDGGLQLSRDTTSARRCFAGLISEVSALHRAIYHHLEGRASAARHQHAHPLLLHTNVRFIDLLHY